MWTWMKCIPRQMYNHSHFMRWMSTKPMQKDLPKNSNVARLVGAITTDVYKSQAGGTRIFYIRTFNPDDFYDTHKIVIPSYAIENLPGIPKTGQKILITGKLQTNIFEQNNGKRGTSIHVMAKQIYLCDNDEMKESSKAESSEAHSNGDVIKFEIKDQNHVEIMAKICFDVLNEDSYSTFSLALHHFRIDTDGQKEEQTDFIPVFVYDETLRNIVRTLNRLDQIRVEGQLKYKPVVDSTGKKQFKGYINANKIAKLTTFRKIIDVKAENISAER